MKSEKSRADIQPGDIVLCQFPTNEGGRLTHYALVTKVEDTLSGMCYARVVYGSSKHVCPSGHLDWEFVLHTAEELMMAGLSVPTRFDFHIQSRMPAHRLHIVGTVDMKNHALVRRLRAAMAATI